MLRIIMNSLLVILLLGGATAFAEEDPEFGVKLQEMLKRTDKSIEIIRAQISENQSAPFISDLYMQLGELISQRANTLYYIQMERHKVSSQSATATKEFNPVVETQKEAVAIFRKILDEFPNFAKRKKILFLLAVTYKSIDEQVGFEDTTERLIKEYGDSQEGMQARLLLGQQYFDKNDFDKAWALFVPVEKSKFPYERNLARYRMALVDLTKEKHKESLELFRSVVVDEELKEEDNPFALSLETKAVKSSLKREALIDSIRAYTYVYKTDPDPVTYYAAICPTEVLFQEVIEKLAYRYISIKKYEYAVGLLRALSERTADPQKVMNIYHEVLLAIPPEDRIEIPVSEIQFVLQRFNIWRNYYDLPKNVARASTLFFEKQIRDLGTKSHDRAKIKTEKNKTHYLSKAQDFYLLYLGFFPSGSNSVKMVTNLADVYFRMGNYLKSGEYYLRTFSGEFGTPQAKTKSALIKNAILVLQKNQKNSYFDQLRLRGLLHRAIEAYMAYDKRQKKNANLVFTFIKNQYDQGFYDSALSGFFDYIKEFKNHKNSINAGEIILDYFNTKNDVTGLSTWADKILSIPNISPVLKTRVQTIRSQVQLKKLQETVKAASGGDEFAQGRAYLTAALQVSDEGLKNVALKQSLSRSRSEQDFETFFKAATLIANKEKNPEQKYKILTSIPQELLGMGRYYAALDQFRKISLRKDISAQQTVEVYNKAVYLALVLRDFSLVHSLLSKNSLKLNLENEKRLYQQIADILESPAQTPEFVLTMALKKNYGALLLSAFKAQFKFPKMREQIIKAARAHCQSNPGEILCAWINLPALDKERKIFIDQISKLGPGLEGVEGTAQNFVKVIGSHQAFLQHRDPTLQIVVTLRLKQLFTYFANYLNRVAKENKDVQQILSAKVQEAARNAQQAHKRCSTIMDSAGLYSPINKFCVSGDVPSISATLSWPKLVQYKGIVEDPQDTESLELQKNLFVNPGQADEYLKLLRSYQKHGYYNLVSAGAAYATSAFPDYKTELNTILGCSLIPLGLYSEAAYYLTSASSDPDAQKCRKHLENLVP